MISLFAEFATDFESSIAIILQQSIRLKLSNIHLAVRQ